MQTGGVGADFNSATAGVISYSLREGRGGLNGRIFVRSSQTGGLEHLGPGLYDDEQAYFDERDALAASPDPNHQALAELYTYYTGKDPYRMQPRLQTEGALGGSTSSAFGVSLTGGYY